MAYHGDKSHAKVLSPEAYCYLLDLVNETILHFQLMPDSVSETKNALYTEIPIVGRSLPQVGYASSSSRSMGLELQFVALEKEGKYTVDWVKQQVRWLESKTYPRYINNFTFPPPKLLLVVGNVIGVQCVMLSCSTNWMGPWAINGPDASPFRATVNIQLQEVGQNDDQWGYPFDHDEAFNSKNQTFLGTATSGSGYVEIPLADSV